LNYLPRLVYTVCLYVCVNFLMLSLESVILYYYKSTHHHFSASFTLLYYFPPPASKMFSFHNPSGILDLLTYTHSYIYMCMYVCILYILCILVVLSALDLLSRHTTTSAMPSSLFGFRYFSDRVLWFLSGASLRLGSSYL
jgi:hypothetical protein